MDPVFGQAKDVRGLLRGMTLNVLARLAAAFEGMVQARESIGVHGLVVQASSPAARVFTVADSLSTAPPRFRRGCDERGPMVALMLRSLRSPLHPQTRVPNPQPRQNGPHHPFPGQASTALASSRPRAASCWA
jgi:hypothetical protein